MMTEMLSCGFFLISQEREKVRSRTGEAKIKTDLTKS